MKNVRLIFLLFTLYTKLISNSFAQTNEENSKSVNIDKAPQVGNNDISASAVKKAVDEFFLSSKIKSLMFDDEQYGNIENAIEAMRNNQAFVPQGIELTKQSDEEAKRQAEELKNVEASEENAKSYIYLSSIMFFSPQSWSLWINETKYMASTNKEDGELFFKDLSQDKITVVWKLSISKWKILSGKKSEEYAPKINSANQVEVEFSLKPNQTFILSSNKVVDGKAYEGNKRK
ncbi:MAG: hypothetical protein ACKO6C_04015 [Alphaproteobacteria bacterium]